MKRSLTLSDTHPFGYFTCLASRAPVGDLLPSGHGNYKSTFGRGSPPLVAGFARGRTPSGIMGPSSQPSGNGELVTARVETRGVVDPCFGAQTFSRSVRDAVRKRRMCARLRKKPMQKTPHHYTGPLYGVLGYQEGERADVSVKESTPGNPRPDIIEVSQVGEDLTETKIKVKEQKDRCNCEQVYCICPIAPAPCRARRYLTGKAHGVLRHLRKFHGIRSVHGIPSDDLSCLNFRRTIRDSLPCDLTLVQELTVKTSSKIVKQACCVCEEQLGSMIGNYKRRLFQPVEVSERDLEQFKRAFALNVEQGWNNGESAYIPNGHATSHHTRKEGGNWNEEGFSALCRVGAVLSSGKPRIVTMYSSYNTSVLDPLHKSLYGTLRRKGWVLIGPPTPEKIQKLNGVGPLMSFDYEAATDNIKAEFVRAAIDILIQKADGLTVEQKKCLRVLGELRFPGSRHAAPRGQPMGSLMSFPLLCLFNKTVVDLAMVDLLENKKVTFKEWTSHRCLINGDDLVLRSPTRDHTIYDEAHRRWGSAIGLVVNREKTMVSQCEGEINSTLFVNGVEMKKTNLAALYMSENTDDVVRTAWDASASKKEFVRMVSLNAHLLARQSDKFPSPVPFECRVALFGSHRIRRALKAVPVSERPAASGPLPMTEKPLGYDLRPEEEHEVIRCAVARVRELELFKAHLERPSRVTIPVEENRLRLRDAYMHRMKPVRELVLTCLARFWEEKRKKALWVEECESLDPPSQIVSDDSRIGAMLDCIRAWKSARLPSRPPEIPGSGEEEFKFDLTIEGERSPPDPGVPGSPGNWNLCSHRELETKKVPWCWPFATNSEADGHIAEASL